MAFSLEQGGTPLDLTSFVCAQDEEVMMAQFVDHVHHLCSQFIVGLADEPQMPRNP